MNLVVQIIIDILIAVFCGVKNVTVSTVTENRETRRMRKVTCEINRTAIRIARIIAVAILLPLVFLFPVPNTITITGTRTYVERKDKRCVYHILSKGCKAHYVQLDENGIPYPVSIADFR